jgi:membrane protease YdiL (CAAX protease family)
MPEGFLTAFAAVANALFLVGGIYIYLALARQIAGSTATTDESERSFGLPEVVLALALVTLFMFSARAAYLHGDKMVMQTNDLIANGLVSFALFLLVAVFLKVRGLSIGALAGLAKLPLWRAIMTGAILLFAAYPLIFLADLLTQRFLGNPSSRQGIVEIFSESNTLQQRVLIITLAVAIAPIVEEFVFRFFFYGVVKRYFGRSVGLLTNSMLFAVVHAHVPSAAPLFVLGICFTLAYEWSGSILVSMTMHALFNSVTLTALAFPDLVQQ